MRRCQIKDKKASTAVAASLWGLNGLADGEEEHHRLMIVHSVVSAKGSHAKYAKGARFREGMWRGFYSVVSKSILLCVWMKFCHSDCG